MPVLNTRPGLGVFAVLWLGLGSAWADDATTPSQGWKTGDPVANVMPVRPNILDRNAAVLAQDKAIVSLYADVRAVDDKAVAARQLLLILPDLNANDLTVALTSQVLNEPFVRIKRDLSIMEQDSVRTLNIPGLVLRQDLERIYPFGRAAAHVLGYVDESYTGQAGIETYIDQHHLTGRAPALPIQGTNPLTPVHLSIDIRANQILGEELQKGMERYGAKSAGGLILDVNTGEVLALASLPDFDPAFGPDDLYDGRMNRITRGVYEFGSVLKPLTLAMALDNGTITLDTKIDTRQVIKFGNHRVQDYRPQNRALTTVEAFVHTSNIFDARVAQKYGSLRFHQVLLRSGMFKALRTELPETTNPIVPLKWGAASAIMIAFGHGLAISPLKAATVMAALINGGHQIAPTFLSVYDPAAAKPGPDLIRPATSAVLRYLMRFNAEEGPAQIANIEGLHVGLSTGTAEKSVDGHYAHDKLFTSFVAVAPVDTPKYLFLTILDEPQALPEDQGYKTSAYNVAPLSARIIERMAPILGLERQVDTSGAPLSNEMKRQLVQ